MADLQHLLQFSRAFVHDVVLIFSQSAFEVCDSRLASCHIAFHHTLPEANALRFWGPILLTGSQHGPQNGSMELENIVANTVYLKAREGKSGCLGITLSCRGDIVGLT